MKNAANNIIHEPFLVYKKPEVSTTNFVRLLVNCWRYTRLYIKHKTEQHSQFKPAYAFCVDWYDMMKDQVKEMLKYNVKDIKFILPSPSYPTYEKGETIPDITIILHMINELNEIYHDVSLKLKIIVMYREYIDIYKSGIYTYEWREAHVNDRIMQLYYNEEIMKYQLSVCDEMGNDMCQYMVFNFNHFKLNGIEYAGIIADFFDMDRESIMNVLTKAFQGKSHLKKTQKQEVSNEYLKEFIQLNLNDKYSFNQKLKEMCIYP